VRIAGAHELRRDETPRPSRSKPWMLTGCIEDNGVLYGAREAGSVR
jgi:hypothetical protein